MRKGFAAALLLVSVLCAAPVHGEPQLNSAKPIKIIVPYSAGGGTDIVARVIAGRLQDRLGIATVVENRTGAGGNLGGELLATAEPDGHTLMFTAQGPLAINKSLYERLGFDPDRFTPVSLVASADMVLVANPSLPARDVPELIALAKKDPGRLSYASQGIGTSGHLTAELFKSMTDTNIVHVPYRGTSPALVDVAAGHVSIMFGEIGPARPYMEDGKLRGLGVTGDKPVQSIPNARTVAATLPGFVVQSWWGMVAPPDTPPAIAGKLSNEIAEILKEPAVSARLVTLDMNRIGNTPEEMGRFLASERERWSKVIKSLGIVVK